MAEKLDLDALERVIALTTPGPWEMAETDENEGHPETVIRGLNGRAGVAVTIDFGKNNPLMREANAVFIAAARKAVPALIARIRELESRATEANDLNLDSLADAMHDAAIRYANGRTVDFQHEALEVVAVSQNFRTTEAEATGKQGAVKDHEITATVNEIAIVARAYHDTQQLRARISRIVAPLLSRAAPSATVDVAASGGMDAAEFAAMNAAFQSLNKNASQYGTFATAWKLRAAAGVASVPEDAPIAETSARIARLLLGDARKVDCDIIESHIRAMLAAAPTPTAPDDVARDAEPMYYLQDSRSYVGNCPLWWATGGSGYTTRLDAAERYSVEKAMAQHKMRKSDVPWPCNQIDAILRPTADIQDMGDVKKHAKALRDAIAASKKGGA